MRRTEPAPECFYRGLCVAVRSDADKAADMSSHVFSGDGRFVTIIVLMMTIIVTGKE